jgi:hypothetical protein
MTYLHCSECNWEQDDFWSIDGYNPLREEDIDFIRHIFRNGMRGEDAIMDIWMAKDEGLEYKEKNGAAHVDFRVYVAWELERLAKKFRNMKWATSKDFQTDPLPQCPQCGSIDALEEE